MPQPNTPHSHQKKKKKIINYLPFIVYIINIFFFMKQKIEEIKLIIKNVTSCIVACSFKIFDINDFIYFLYQRLLTIRIQT